MKRQSTINNQQSTISFWNPVSLLCTVFGVGKIPFAPGTWGSLAGVGMFVCSPIICIMALVPMFFFGVGAANIYEKKSGKHDSKEIVIDEVVGQWITILLGLFLVQKLPQFQNPGLGFIVMAYAIWFLLFRLFDIVKRGPVGWVDRNVHGGMGVMLDDVVAGVFAGLTSALIFWLLSLI